MERVGAEYARTVVENARALGTALHQRGLPVSRPEVGFTRSHQLLLDRAALRERHRVGPGELCRRWERNRLITDYVGRLGTAEVTRLGLTPEQMDRLADLLYRAGVERKSVAAEVLRWRKEFRELRFA
jgi:glycine hydroxymethyltransferase